MNELLPEQSKMKLGLVFKIMFKYKISIFVIFIVSFSVALVIAYFKPITYTSVITMEVAEEKKNRGDTLALALGESGSNFANEKEVITSRYLINKALDRLDLGRRYFTVENFKTVELYKQSPFIVDVKHFDRKLYGKMLYIKPVDTQHYQLEIKKDSLFTKRSIKNLLNIDKSESFEFSQTFVFGEEAVSPWFTIKIEKVFDLGMKEYSFSVVPNEAMYYHIVGGLRASLTNRQGSIIAISYRDNVALRAKEVVQEIANVYMQDQIEKKRESAEEILKFIDGELEALNVNLDKSANKLKSYKQVNQITDLESSAVSIKQRVDENDIKLSEIYLEEELLGGFHEYMKSGKDLSGIAIEDTQVSNKSLISKIQKYQELNELKRQYLASYTEFHPDVIKVKNELSLVKENIEFIIETSLKNLQQKKNWLKKQNEKLLASLEVLPQQERKLSNLTRNFEVNEKIYLYLLERRSETAILQASTISKTRIIDEPIVPGPNPSKRMFIVLVGAMVGMMLGFIQAYIRSIMNNVILDTDEVEAITKVPFYGLIPKRSNLKYTLAYDEAFRTLRTNLEFLQVEGPSKKILVTSAVSGEGKSTTVKHLAEMLIKLNRKVIVLDFDLRRPSLHKYFKNMGNEVGLSMLISGQVSLHEAIQRTSEGIDLITSGPTPPNPSELIMSDGCQLLLQTLAKTYDYILLDSPPYSVVADATILMQDVDITLFSIMSEYTKRDYIQGIDETVKKYALKSTGLVFHGVKQRREEKHGYGYYE